MGADKVEKMIPKHVAIIMDGNGRWAKQRGLKRSEGHLKGSLVLEDLVVHAKKRGISMLSVYAFSTDNFKRPKEEVDYLMNLFIKMFTTKFKRLMKENVKVVFSGRREGLKANVLKAMDQIVEKTTDNTAITLNICLNYGGQEEIVDAVNKIVKDVKCGNLSLDTIDKHSFYHYLYQDLPPVDFLIRTSGEQRVSNFMLYQMSYSELYFTNTFFPDFDEEQFDIALVEYERRNRTFGEVK